MDRRCAISKALTLLCALTLLLVQSFGAITGYLCRCGGQESYTQVDHCHGPHSEDCHDLQEQDAAHERALDHQDETTGDRENHEPIRKDIELVQSSVAAAPGHTLVLLAVLPDLPFLSFRAEDTQLAVSHRNVRLAPPPGVVVGRTIVLLV